MSVLAEFVGGPLDGDVCEMPDARNEWRFPIMPPISLIASTSSVDHSTTREVIYHKDARRNRNAPSGEPVIRYVLRD